MAWLKKWEPENPQFWKENSGLAWRTLILTTWSLIFSFATWFTMSAVVVRLPNIGFKFDTNQLFWLAAIPGLASGLFRLVHSVLIPILGTRTTITVATLIKVIPCLGIAVAVMNPNTSFTFFMVFAFLSGFGGGDFSSYMPSSSLFFPKRLQGVAMGIQAGIGNFGVGLTQFVTPWIIGFAALGALAGGPQLFTKADPVKEVVVVKEAGVVKNVTINKPELASSIVVVKEGDVIKDVVKQETDATKNIAVTVKKDAAGAVTDVAVKKVIKKDMWVQNALLWYVPILVGTTVLCFIFLKSVPIKASIAEQLKIVKDKHGWFCTWTYITTFGSFAGFAAAFPLLIKVVYGGFPGAPDPLKFAFYGPMIGGGVRFLFGAPSDKWGGAILTQVAILAEIAGCVFLIATGSLTPTSVDQFPLFVGGMLWIFFWTGVGNAATFRLYPIVFAYSARKGAQALGWTGAWAAFGPFIFAIFVGMSIAKTGNPVAFFVGATIFYIIAAIIQWWFYTRPGAERGDWGNKWGTWWDTAKDTWGNREM
ncbi:MAG: NarK/NasA family nitrate transporter [Deltaproteobacteria bacterium]|nr:NarK/NasA family nitrate transporter [Deltaproteobacteria bacterium]